MHINSAEDTISEKYTKSVGMDPTDFVAHMLPKIEYYELHPSKSYSINSKSCYAEFCEEFAECVSGDCHAITVDDEILYNCYEPKSIRNSLRDDMIRQKIMDNPHELFVKLFRLKKDARVIVYMFAKSPWFLAVYYNPKIEMLTVEYYKSKKYMDTYESPTS